MPVSAILQFEHKTGKRFQAFLANILSANNKVLLPFKSTLPFSGAMSRALQGLSHEGSTCYTHKRTYKPQATHTTYKNKEK